MQERFNNQHIFTEKVLNYMGYSLSLSDADKIKWTKEYLLCIISECMEVLERLNWKHHKDEEKKIDLVSLGIELIDIQKFLWGLSKIWEIGYDKFIELYDLKTIEVEKLWDQEHIFDKLSTKDKVCIIDIDGVLTDYPKCFYDWAERNCNVKLLKEEADPVLYESCKELYRTSGYKKYLPVVESSKEALIKLKELGYSIVILTNRPYKKYPRIYTDTIVWLKENNIPYDYIYWGEERKILSIIDKCKDIRFIVDDSLENCKDFELAGIKSYLYGGKKNSKMITSINSLLEIGELK